jgi:[protein-PII] uridylyltransferase
VPAAIAVDEIEIPAAARAGSLAISVEAVDDGSRVTTVSTDRVGLLADCAATFALQRLQVRAARIWAQGEYGVAVWDVADDHLDAGRLRNMFDSVAERRVDPAARLGPRANGSGQDLAPTVVLRPEASDQATVIEVRAADRLGVVYLVSAVLAELGLSVRSAHISTLGPQAVDVFYVRDAEGEALPGPRAAAAATAIRERLSPPPDPPEASDA